MTRALKFTKGHGTGNDFVLFSDPGGVIELSQDEYAFLADRHRGVGGDGVIRAIRSEYLPEGRSVLASDPDAEWFMDYRNADGSIVEMCGNGIRVFLAYLIAEKHIDLKAGARVAIATRAGVKDVQWGANGVIRVDLGRWRKGDSSVAPKEGSTVATADGVAREAYGISMGNPHAVVFVDDEPTLATLDLRDPPVVVPSFSDGVNIEFVVLEEPLVVDGVGRLSLRVHERGVGETLSCGTGAAAAALAARQREGVDAPNNWRVEVPGGALGVQMFPTEDGEHVSLSGPAELLFSGVIAI